MRSDSGVGRSRSWMTPTCWTNLSFSIPEFYGASFGSAGQGSVDPLLPAINGCLQEAW